MIYADQHKRFSFIFTSIPLWQNSKKKKLPEVPTQQHHRSCHLHHVALDRFCFFSDCRHSRLQVPSHYCGRGELLFPLGTYSNKHDRFKTVRNRNLKVIEWQFHSLKSVCDNSYREWNIICFCFTKVKRVWAGQYWKNISRYMGAQ